MSSQPQVASRTQDNSVILDIRGMRVAVRETNGDPDRLHFERFQPKIGGDAAAGEGGKVCFLESEKTVECDGGISILEAGEKAGLNLAYGCRIGICHTCVGTLKSGKLRDLRSGDVIEPTEQDVRICINTAEGDVELEL